MDALLAEQSPIVDDLISRGKHIKDRRELEGLSQETLGSLSGTSVSSVQRAESGDAAEKTVNQIERALDKWEADQHADPSAVHEVELGGVFGVDRVIVRSPDSETLREDIIEVLRALREGTTDK